MYYILFEKLSKQDIDEIIDALEKKDYYNSRMGATRSKAVGIATTPKIAPSSFPASYTFLSEKMSSEDSRISWIFNRKKCNTKKEFIEKIK
jgi:hypothetical protein